MYFRYIFQSIILVCVALHADNTRTITSDCAILDDKLHTLQFNGNVTSQNGELSFTADSAEVKYGNKFNSLNSAKLNGNVCVKFRGAKVTADHAMFDGNSLNFFSDSFSFEKKKFCLFINQDIRMISRNMSAALENKSVKTISAQGNVYILHNNSIIKADSAEFNKKKNCITFRGNVAILDAKKNFVKCNYCKIDLNKKKYHISGKIRGDILL